MELLHYIRFYFKLDRHDRILSLNYLLATKQENASLVDFDYYCHIALLDTKFLLCSLLCSYRAGTREVHNKLEKNRWVQPVYYRASLKRGSLFVLLYLNITVCWLLFHRLKLSLKLTDASAYFNAKIDHHHHF